MHEKEKEKRESKMLSQGGGSGGDQIGPSVATQSKYYGLLRNPPFVVSFLCTLLLSPK